MSKTGLLISNLGSPDAPTEEALRRYLKQFLIDGRVIDVPFFVRWFLVNVIIVPRRAPKSAANYKRIWTEPEGPLKNVSKAFCHELAARLGHALPIALGMRYGSPSIESAVMDLVDKGVSEIVVLPLYPQYSEAATGSTLAEVDRVVAGLQRRGRTLKIQSIRDFFDRDFYIHWHAQAIRKAELEFRPDHVLMSFHGLPVRQVKRANSLCKADSCCATLTVENRSCYRAQCMDSGRRIAKAAGLSDVDFTVSFQSRLGRAEWICPDTVSTAKALAARGRKRLLVLCPGFTADNLETLEEIGLQLREEYLHAGGSDFRLVPCPNVDPTWVQGVEQMVRGELGR